MTQRLAGSTQRLPESERAGGRSVRGRGRQVPRTPGAAASAGPTWRPTWERHRPPLSRTLQAGAEAGQGAVSWPRPPSSLPLRAVSPLLAPRRARRGAC